MLPLERLVRHDLFDERVPLDRGSRAIMLPIVVCRKPDSFSVIDGCKRVALLRAAGKAEAACSVIGADLDPVEAALLRIELNCGRTLHAREKLLFVGWLKNHVGDTAYRELTEKLGFNPQERHEYEELLACDVPLLEAVFSGRLDPAVAPEMSHLKEPDAQALIGLFSRLSFSRQMQRELAEWIPEIAFIRKVTVPQLLLSATVDEVLSDKRLNDPQKAARIHEQVHDIRFPLYAEARRRYAARSRKINPDPARVVFQAGQYFENRRLEIRIRADDPAAIGPILTRLAAVRPEEWQALMDPMSKPQNQ